MKLGQGPHGLFLVTQMARQRSDVGGNGVSPAF